MAIFAFERQERESAKAFEAFSVYLNLGAERSLAAVAQKLAKSEQLVKRWSAKFDWSARVQAHAAHLAMVERQALEVVARAKAVEWGARQQQVREREWQLHERAITAAERALDAFMSREKVYANLADISRILEVASKLGRLASGMATDRTEVTGEDGGPVRVEFELALKKIYGPQGGGSHQVAPSPSPAASGIIDVEASTANSKVQTSSAKEASTPNKQLPAVPAVEALPTE